MRRFVLLTGMIILSFAGFSGCGSKADTSKPIDEVRAEAEKMPVNDLEKKALAYAEAIVEKKEEVTVTGTKLKDLSPKEIIGEKGRELKDRMSELSREITELTKRYDIYASHFREAGGDISRIKIS